MRSTTRCEPRWLLVAPTAMLLGACMALPRSGPSLREVRDAVVAPNGTRVALIDVDEAVLDNLAGLRAPGLSKYFPDAQANGPLRIGIGDELVVDLWEAAPASLFAVPAPMSGVPTGSTTTLPAQIVDEAGRIVVPFIGGVDVAGLTPLEARERIAERLARKMNQPQALVRITQPRGGAVTVLGDVRQPGRLPLSPKGDRLLDAVAASGGTTGPLNQTTVALTRGGVTASAALVDIMARPDDNLGLQPGDLVTVMHEPLSFIALGASGVNGEIRFDTVGVSLAQAVARAGGLLDVRADPGGVFVFRLERPTVLYALGAPAATPIADGRVPVIYRFDFSESRALFHSQRFAMRDDDVLYIANAPLNSVQKFFTLLQTLTSPAVTWAVVDNAVD